jgi:hypothetical protein
MRAFRSAHLLLCVALLGLATPALGDPPPQSPGQLLLLLNGTPSKLGTLVSAAGATVSNSTTGTPFATVVVGGVYLIWCDADVYFNANGGTAVVAATSANAGQPLTAKERHWWVATSDAIFRMK